MSVCGFCGENATLTVEDAIPKWMAQLKPENVRVKAEWEHRNVRKWTTWKNKVELTARAFCGRCNNGWMSDLENEAKPYLIPMLLGYEVKLPSKAQTIVSIWVMKTTMVMEFTGASTRAKHFTPLERRTFSVLQTPPSGVLIFLAGYVGRHAFSAQEHHLNFRRDGNRFPGYSATLQWGALIGQVLAHRGGSESSRFQVRATYDPAECEVWPMKRATITWPPEAVLDDVELPRYAQRWLPPEHPAGEADPPQEGDPRARR